MCKGELHVRERNTPAVSGAASVRDRGDAGRVAQTRFASARPPRGNVGICSTRTDLALASADSIPPGRVPCAREWIPRESPISGAARGRTSTSPGVGSSPVRRRSIHKSDPTFPCECCSGESKTGGPQRAFAWTSRRPPYGVQPTDVTSGCARVGAPGGSVSQMGMPRQLLQAASHSGTRPSPWWKPCQTEDASDCAESEPSAPPNYLFETTLGAYSWS